MRLEFDICLYGGEMAVYAQYAAKELPCLFFYINRDVVFESFICDGTETNPVICGVNMTMFDGYAASKIMLPPLEDSFEIKYRLKLSGKTGCAPYVRERITRGFTFLRWETFCYPMFFEDWNGFRIAGFESSIISIVLPVEYDVAASVHVVDTIMISPAKKKITFLSEKRDADIFDCAIAPYSILTFPFGSIYCLGSMGMAKADMVVKAMDFALNYMNEHFGRKEFKNKLTFASIPDGFGSFVCPDAGVVFIQESTFENKENLNQIIHEFIHLGWNAVIKDTVQRARFFDEAFTSYFETRVMRNLLDNASLTGFYKGRYGIEAILKGKYQLVPICDYGKMGYGDLSYTIGAMCIEALSDLVGESIFDQATAIFLEKFNKVPVDFEDFCNEYILLCGEENADSLKRFFNDWIYSCDALRKFLDNQDTI